MRIVLLMVFLAALSCQAVAADAFSFVVLTDIHIKAGNMSFAQNLSDLVAEINAIEPRPEFALFTGDQTEMGFEDDYVEFNKIASGLKMPIFNVAGNHETKWSNWGKAGPKKFFGQPPYYAFDCGGIRFVAMDSSMWLEHHGLFSPDQLAWLRVKLDAVGRDRPAVLFFHAAPNILPNMLEFMDLIRPYNVPLILVGHGHQFVTYRQNGTIVQMTKGAMNDTGGFRIYEVSGDEIRGYTKLGGEARVPDLTIPLRTQPNPVYLLRPKAGARVDGQVDLRAVVLKPFEKIEYGIDGAYKPLTRGTDGLCETTIAWDGTPGWHMVSVRAIDADKMEWYDSALVRIGGGDREAWRMRASGAVQRPIRAYGDRLYFGTWGGDVYCLDARTGREVWRGNVGSDVISEVAVDKGLAYLGATDGRVIALNADTGDLRWEYETGGPIQASPVVGGGRVFIGSGDCSFYALDARTGSFRWKFEMARMTQSRPVYMDGAVFFGAWDQHFYALDAKNGSVRWKTPIGELIYFSPANSNPATDGRRIVVASTPWPKKTELPDINCLDAKTGEILWTHRCLPESHCAFNTASIAGDRLYISSLNGKLFCLSMADGSEVWRSDIGQETYDNSPVYSDGKIYAGGLKGGLFCFDRSGKREWAYSVGAGFTFASPTIWDDLVIAASTDGWVTAVKR